MAVTDSVMVGQPETPVITVISHLVEHHTAVRIHLQKPLQAPFYLVKYVRYTIAACCSGSIPIVGIYFR